MKTQLLVFRITLLFLSVGLVHAAPLPVITIKATKKTGDSRKSVEQIGNLRRRTDTEKELYYQLEIAALSQNVPTNIAVTWAVLIESEKGRLRLGCLGGTETNFTRTVRTLQVQTDSFELEEHTQQRARQNISRGSEIYGYGIRVTDLTGKILAEKVEPSKAAAEINEAFEGKHAARPDR